MSQKHIIEIRGGPFDGILLDLAESSYRETELQPGAPFLGLFGIPVYVRPDDRRFVNWSDIVRCSESAVDELVAAFAKRHGLEEVP